jgi:hypothetical protein
MTNPGFDQLWFDREFGLKGFDLHIENPLEKKNLSQTPGQTP